MELQPYIFFYGRCEEALQFYKEAIGGEYDLNRFKDSPMEGDVPPGSDDKVMHATFRGPGFTFMASDGQLGKTIDPDAGNIALSLETNDAKEGERVFNALAEGGKVIRPMAEAFWGGRFGMLTDRFGNEWMVSTA